ncbi:Conserved oligomeric Golgi complex subunit 2 [Ranunculus cassubicifolius]
MTDLISQRSTDIFGDPIDSHPLWFKKDTFLQPNFDSEIYISDLRSFVPFDNLRSELQSHLSSLKNELVELINRDYADFVNLSTKLVDVDGAILRMRAPLTELRDKISMFKNSVELSLAALQNRLRQRNEASSAREVLELLLDTFHVVSKVEKLIKELPSVPSDWSTNGDVGSNAEVGTNLRETQSMLLERIASEMNRLKFYIAHAQNLPFIENMEKRIQSASSLLDASLGHCFVDGLGHRDENAIYNCLRAYAAIDNTTGAEEIFRKTVVSPLIENIIPNSSSKAGNGTLGDELEEDYQRIMECIEKDCKFLLDISSSENSGLHVFDFLANSILKEVLWAIQKGKPGAFSPGRPTEFLKNYKSSLVFLAHLEGYCASRSAVSKFRSEAVYIEFMKQWNLGVYFSLRFQEIAVALDNELMEPSLTINENPHGNLLHLTLKQSVTFLESLRSCWKEDVLVISSADKFLRLSLQLMSRYSTWLSAGLACKMDNTGSSPATKWAISAGPEDFIYVLHDTNCLITELGGDYLESVVEILSSCPAEILNMIKQSILQGVESLKNVAPQAMKTITTALVDRGVDDLRQIKGITATYRMTNKPLPVTHSPYVVGILRPLNNFLGGERATTYLTKEARHELILSVTEKITHLYDEKVSEVVDLARKTESSLQKIRQGAQRRAGASSDVSDNYVSDTDKIRMQLFLDVQEYGRKLAVLGVEARNFSKYHSLWRCVAPAERQNEISF